MRVQHIKSDMYYSGVASLAALFVLCVLAMVFWKERMTFLDAPFILFRMINAESLMIMEYRYGAIASQWLPYLGIKLGIPAVGLVWLYNMAFNAFYLMTGLLLFRWRQYALLVVMALYYTVTAGEAFFWTNNEIHQAVGWMFLWMGLFQRQMDDNVRNRWKWVTFLPLCFLAVVTHPLMVLLVPFVWVGMVSIMGWHRKDRLFFTKATGVVMAMMLLRLLLSMYAGWYDADKLGSLQSRPIGELFNVFNAPMMETVVRLYFIKYWAFSLMVLSTILAIIYFKKWLWLIGTTLFTVIYLWLFLLVFHEYIPFYSDSELMPLTIVWGLPLVYFFINKMPARWGVLPILLLIIAGIFQLLSASKTYVQRLETTYTILDSMQDRGINKGVISEDEILASRYIMYWGSPVESLIAGILRDDAEQRTFLIVPEEGVSDKINAPENVFHDCFQTIPMHSLNSDYFSIDTLQSYRQYQPFIRN